MSINMVVASGIVKSLALKYDQQSRPEVRFTMVQRDGEFSLYLPCFSPGAAAERLAAELDDGMHIVITSGRLAYRKRATKDRGEQSRLEILVWSVDQLPQDDVPGAVAVSPEGPQEIVQPRGEGAASLGKKGQPRYSKHVKEAWTPNTYLRPIGR